MVQLGLVGHSLPELLGHLDAADVAAADAGYVAVDIAAGGVVAAAGDVVVWDVVVWVVVDCCMSVQLQPAGQAVAGAPAHPTPAGLASFDAVVSFASAWPSSVPTETSPALRCPVVGLPSVLHPCYLGWTSKAGEGALALGW